MNSGATSLAVDTALRRADAGDARSIFTLRLDERARREAEVMDRAGQVGIPISVKDNFDLAGHSTTAGSTLLAKAPPAARDAPVVDRLRKSGRVVIGRTNMTEFAFSGLGLNPHYGTPANPAFPGEQRIPGGSSSGAAVSVALGITSAAIGTDTGGSVRIPAALCGLVGFKPSADAVTREGVLPLSTTLDGVGVIARSVDDCAVLFDAIRDRSSVRRTDMFGDHIRLGLVSNYVGTGVEPHVERAMWATIDRLTDAGVSVVPANIPEFDEIPAATREATFPAYEAAAWHATLLTQHEAEYDPRVLVRIRAGQAMSPDAYARLGTWRRGFIERVGRRMAGFDALIWPTVPFAAPTIESLSDDATYHAMNGLSLRNSTVANLFDGCAISIPCPVAGAPVGITLAALHGRDDHLLSTAATVHAILEGA